MRSIRMAAVLAVLAAVAIPVQAEDVSVKSVLFARLANVPGKAMTMARVTIPPGAASPSHHHAGAVGVYVLKGALKSAVNDGPVTTYHAGETFFEPPGATHRVSENASKSEVAEILAVFVADQGATLTTYDK